MKTRATKDARATKARGGAAPRRAGIRALPSLVAARAYERFLELPVVVVLAVLWVAGAALLGSAALALYLAWGALARSVAECAEHVWAAAALPLHLFVRPRGRVFLEEGPLRHRSGGARATLPVGRAEQGDGVPTPPARGFTARPSGRRAAPARRRRNGELLARLDPRPGAGAGPAEDSAEAPRSSGSSPSLRSVSVREATRRGLPPRAPDSTPTVL